MKKRASLEMSMYAIVLVILAIMVLALGMVFIRTVFKNLGTRVQEAVSAQEIVNPPTLDIPMTATPPSFELRGGDVKKSSLAFMNVLSDYAYCQISNRVTGTPGFELLYSEECMMMGKDQINIWTVIASPDDVTPAGTTIFTMLMSCYDAATTSCIGTAEAVFTTDITVTVRE